MLQRSLATISLAFFLLTLAFLPRPARADLAELKLGIGWWPGYVGIYVAEEKGFFAEEGVKVDIVNSSTLDETMRFFIAGHLDIATLTGLEVLIANRRESQRKPQVIYFADASNGADGLVARADIPSLQALRGREVAVMEKSLTHMVLLLALEEAGMSENDIKWVEMDTMNAGSAVLAGQVASAVTWEPYISKGQSQGLNLLFSSAEPSAQGLIADLLAVAPDLSEEKSMAVEAFLRAMVRGVEYYKAHEKETLAILSKVLETDEEEIRTIMSKLQIFDLNDNKSYIEGGEKSRFMQSLGRIMKFSVEKNIIDQEIDLAPLLNPKYIHAMEGE